MLYDSLKSKHPSGYVLHSNRVNQDCLENLFGMFQNKNRNNQNPTLVQFCVAFRNLVSLNYFQHSPNANCIKHLDETLCRIHSQEADVTNFVMPEPVSRKINFNFKTNNVEYRHLNLPESNELHCVLLTFMVIPYFIITI